MAMSLATASGTRLICSIAVERVPSSKVSRTMFEQVGALLVGRPVHDGLKLHRDERPRLGDACHDLDLLAVAADGLDEHFGGGFDSPRV